MLFSSVTFLFVFLPIVLLVYYICPRKAKNYILLIASLLFYAWGEPKYIFIMLISIFIGYISGILINLFRIKVKNGFAKLTVIISCILCILFLFFFKYFDFFITNINAVAKTEIKLLKLALPLGISFYTFQILSYTVDVYNKKVDVQKNIIDLATYITFFPQLIAGPIVRYNTVWNELENRKENFDDFGEGVRRFVIGLGKKIIIANTVGEMFNSFKVLAGDEKTVLLTWMASIAFTIQIYFDFSGYSDMAIGLGRMFGFHFMENFDYPYISKSITEFWRRWHISLSTWFKDYVYIPLGGNRRSNIITVRNMFIVWTLTGFWHGAKWNYIIWGIYYFILLVFEKNILKNFIDKIPNWLSHIYALFFINIGWVIFSHEDINELIYTLKSMFGLEGIPLCNDLTLYNLISYGIIMVISFVLATPIVSKLMNKVKWLELAFVFVILVLSTAYLAAEGFNPFLYFRF